MTIHQTVYSCDHDRNPTHFRRPPPCHSRRGAQAGFGGPLHLVNDFASMSSESAAAPVKQAAAQQAEMLQQQFDARGRLLRWPTKFSVQALAMWVLWTLFDARRVYTEREVNQILSAANAFGDAISAIGWFLTAVKLSK